MGVPLLIGKPSDLQTISRLSHQYLSSDPNFANQVEIQRIVAKATNALQEQSDDATGSVLSLIEMFDNDFKTFRLTSKNPWSTETEFQFLTAKLFVYGWSFPAQTDIDQHSIDITKPPTSRRLILYEAMCTAARIIHTFSELPNSQKSDLPPQVHFPKAYFYTLYYSTVTLYLFLSCFPTPSSTDRDLCLNSIRDSHNLLIRCSLNNPRNQWARMAHNLEWIGKWHASGWRLPPEAKIRSRMGASLFYDAMQKIAVLKAEKGGRGYCSDLTKPMPNRDKDRERLPGLNNEEGEVHTNLEGPMIQQSAGQGLQQSVVAHIDAEDQGWSTATAWQAMPVEQQAPLDHTSLLMSAWDESMWGWDLSMLDTTDMNMDVSGMGPWQL